jgi:Uncharacterised nucleotidyltransferase
VTPEEVLISVARHGLHPSTRPLIDRPLAGDAWQPFVDELSRGLLLAFAVDATATGALPVTPAQEAELSDRLGQATGRRAAVDHCLDEMVAALDLHGVSTCVVHDAALAALDYERPQLRLYETVHLLMSPGQRKRGVAALKAEGVLRAGGPTSWPRRKRSQTYVSSNGVLVTILTSIAPRNSGVSAGGGDDPVSHQVTFKPRSVLLNALRPEERLIAACIRARLDRSRHCLLAQRDVVQLVLQDDVSVSRVERVAVLWKSEAVLAQGVRQAWDTLAVPDVVPISAWSRSYQPSRRHRRRLAAHPRPRLDA